MSKQAVTTRLKEIGGKLERDSDSRRSKVYQAVAPKGMQWHDPGGPHIRIELFVGDNHDEVWADALQRINAGFEPKE
jgi:hypothetical protein